MTNDIYDRFKMTVDKLQHEAPIIVRKLSKALDEAIKKDEDGVFDEIDNK